MSVPLRVYNQNVCQDPDRELWAVISDSNSFAWTACRDTTPGSLHHTSIALYFDNVPKFTLNFRLKDGTSKLWAAFSNAPPAITLEYVTGSNFEYFPVLKQFCTLIPPQKFDAWYEIQKLCSYDPGCYNLIRNNCRDFVLGVVRQNYGRSPNFEKTMRSIVTRDNLKMVAVPVLGIALVGGVYYFVNN